MTPWAADPRGERVRAALGLAGPWPPPDQLLADATRLFVAGISRLGGTGTEASIALLRDLGMLLGELRGDEQAVGHPLPWGPELAALHAALLADPPVGLVQTARKLLVEPARAHGIVHRLARLPNGGSAATFLALYLPLDRRRTAAAELALSPVDRVRAELYRLMSQPLISRGHEPENAPAPPLAEPAHTALLRLGLEDPHRGVRLCSVQLAWVTSRAAAVRAQLVEAARADPDPETHSSALVALGSFADPDTLQLLEQALAGPDEAAALSAIRALDQRPDGRVALARALQDPRESVRLAALARRSTGVGPGEWTAGARGKGGQVLH